MNCRAANTLSISPRVNNGAVANTNNNNNNNNATYSGGGSGGSSSSSKNAIKFNDLHDVPYGIFSPLSPHPVTIRHITYPSVNHYFQSQRFLSSSLPSPSSPSPSAAASNNNTNANDGATPPSGLAATTTPTSSSRTNSPSRSQANNNNNNNASLSASLSERIAAAPSLWELDRLVRKAEELGLQDPNWDDHKTDVMLIGNYYKFRQHSDCKAVLLSTATTTSFSSATAASSSNTNATNNANASSSSGGKIIIYHTAETFWGDGNDGTSGKNLLGVILMGVRKRIAAEDAAAANANNSNNARGRSVSYGRSVSGGGGAATRR